MGLTVGFLENMVKNIQAKLRGMFMDFETKNLFHFSTGKMEQKNIVDPLAKIVIVLTPILGILCWCGFVEWVLGIVIAFLVFYVTVYAYCLCKMPDKLHTEKYLLTRQQMEIQQNSKDEAEKMKLINVAPENTQLLFLPKEEEEKL